MAKHCRSVVLRAISEISRGMPIIIDGNHEGRMLVLPVMALDFLDFRSVISQDMFLAISPERSSYFGVGGDVALSLPKDMTDAEILECATSASWEKAGAYNTVAQNSIMSSAIKLMKQASVIPGAVCIDLPKVSDVADRLCRGILDFPLTEVDQFMGARQSVSEMRRTTLHLNGIGAVDAAVFAESFSHKQHVSIAKNLGSGVPIVRAHSKCFFGDTLHSLTCDCWGQLHICLDSMLGDNAHVLLYLDQEGRDIGLVGKMFAYNLQRDGHDTWDANRILGFADDARRFDVAASILVALGVNKCRLMTSNLNKIAALEAAGIEVVDSVGACVAVDKYNADYLRAKQGPNRPYRGRAD